MAHAAHFTPEGKMTDAGRSHCDQQLAEIKAKETNAKHTPDSVLVRIPNIHSRGLFNEPDSIVEAYICLPRAKYDAVVRLYKNGSLWDQCLGDKDEVISYIAESQDMRVCDVEAALALAKGE